MICKILVSVNIAESSSPILHRSLESRLAHIANLCGFQMSITDIYWGKTAKMYNSKCNIMKWSYGSPQ